MKRESMDQSLETLEEEYKQVCPMDQSLETLEEEYKSALDQSLRTMGA